MVKKHFCWVNEVNPTWVDKGNSPYAEKKKW